MNVLIPFFAGVLILLLGGRAYSFFLGRKLGLDPSNPTPAFRLNDQYDYVPSRTHVVFGHHFATIAGAGPIVGPTLALIYGWGPAWMWIVFGCVLFGAVHDMTCMFVSMREDGRSIADMSRRSLGTAGYILMVAFLIMILTLINAIFLNLSCKALTAAYPAALLKLEAGDTILHTFTNDKGVLMGRIGGIATTSVFIITFFAPILGWLNHKRKIHTGALYALAGTVCVASILLGFKFPIQLDENTWRYVMTVYVFLACWIPVWLLMQPRDFTNVQILYGGLIVMGIGLLLYGFRGGVVQAGTLNVAEGTRLAGGTLWPFLFITIACGAISGFHSLAATGTSVKQIESETDVRRVGYNAMLLEGVLALFSLLLLSTALPSAEYRSIVYPADMKASNPVLAFSVAMGYLLHDLTGLKIAIGSVIGILVLEGFVITTLDTAVRLCRYMLEELWSFVFAGKTPAVFKHPFFNTALAVALMLFFALNSTIQGAWKIFGAGNQLIAALAMTVVTVWLLQRAKTFWFTLIPAVAMTVTTLTTLSLSLRKSWGAAGQGAMTGATVILLVLSVGFLAVAVRKFVQLRRAAA